jgi:hypothetical protein
MHFSYLSFFTRIIRIKSSLMVDLTLSVVINHVGQARQQILLQT